MSERDEGQCAFGARVENNTRQAVARRLGEANVARDHGIEHLVVEVCLELEKCYRFGQCLIDSFVEADRILQACAFGSARVGPETVGQS